MSKEAPRSAFLRLARNQYGLLSRAQCLACGLSASSVDRRVVSGQFEVILPGVYSLLGVPSSWHQKVMAACLWAGAGAVSSHRTAGALWGLDGIPPGFVEITTPRRLRSKEVFVHQSLLMPGDATTLGNIPVTDVTRSLIDLGSVVAREAVEAALDDALRRRLTSLRVLRQRLDDLGGKGRRGAGILRSLLEERDPSRAPAESVLESRLVRMLRQARLPQPVSQYEIRIKGRLLARVDLAYPEVHLAIEADGYRYHSGRVAWQRDLHRRNSLTSIGWRVIHVTWKDVVSDGERVLAEIRQALGEPGQLPLAHGKSELYL